MTDKGLRGFRIQAAIAVILALFLMGVTAGTPFKTAFEGAVAVILDIPERPARFLLDGLLASRGWIRERVTLLEQMEGLRAENLALRRRIEEGLMPPLDVKEGERTLTARVLLRSPRTWWREVRIDKGDRDGVSPGDPAMSGGFLVGRVTHVERTFSTVELLSSSGLLVPVVVDQTRDLGVVTGDEEGQIHLLYLPVDRTLVPEMSLSTALVSERLPPGIPVGYVGAEEPDDGTFRPYSVRLGADLTRLYRVQIWSSGEDRAP